MNNEVKLGFSEAFGLVVICVITKMFYGFLPFQVQNFATASWYISIISAILVFIAFFVAVRGGGFGRITAFLVAVYFVLYTAMNLRETVRVIKIYNFPETPEWVFALAFLIAAAVICKNDSFGGMRLAGLYSKLIIGAVIVIFLVGIKQYDFQNLAPVGGYGVLKTAEGSFSQMTVFSDVFLLAVLKKCTGGREKALKCGAVSMAVGGLITALSSVFYIAVYDYSVVGGKTSGLIEVIKNAYYGHLLQRMESLFFLVMIVASAVSVCVWVSAVVYMLSKALGTENTTAIALAVTVILFLMTVSDFGWLFEMVGRYGGVFLAVASVVSYCSRRRI